MSSSRIKGLYRLSVPERVRALEEAGWLDAGQASDLLAGRHLLAPSAADHITENVVGVFGLPFSVAPNFTVNGRDCLVPLVVEEPSIVAALSFAAGLARESGGFSASCDESLLVGQVHISGGGPNAAVAIRNARDELVAFANEVHPRLLERGGGVADVEVHELELADGEAVLAVHLLVDTCDAMGANLVNTICEAIAPKLEEISGGEVAMRILSNLADRSVVNASVRYPVAVLATAGLGGEQVRDRIVRANDIALADPHRATTHNKGIMNGIDPVVIATGNDWRAVEAGAHAWAARDGQYRALTRWTVGDNGDLVGEISVPIKVGTVGGTLASNKAAALGLALTGCGNARELAELLAAVGLAQNFAAIRALATSGIQKGHMRLHARSLAAAAGAPASEIDRIVQQMIDEGNVKAWRAEELVAALASTQTDGGDVSTAAGKIILLGEHAAVYGRYAVAIPVPDAVRVKVSPSEDATSLSVCEWNLYAQIDRTADTGVDALVNRIFDQLGLNDLQLHIGVTTRLARGKGLGSSAAFAVAITRAIARHAGMDIDDERVNAIAFECEKIAHGTPSGLDNTISCYSKPLLFRRADDVEIKTLEPGEMPPFVVGVGKGTGATHEMVAGVRARREVSEGRYDAIFDQVDAMSRDGAKALVAGDYESLGRYMNLCHGLMNAIEVSTPELEEMVGIARDHGAIGAKLTGAGGGGSVVALCPGAVDQVRSALAAAGFETIVLASPGQL